MDKRIWARIETAIDTALERPQEERDAWLVSRLDKDTDALKVARSVIGALEDSRDFLDRQTFPQPAKDESDPVGSRYGAWRVDGMLGRGGMGIVYAVSRVEGGFEQSGALKLVRADAAIDQRRFEWERQLLAELDHPGIARLLDGGIDADGRPWMVMEHVDGIPIDQWSRQTGAPLATRIAKVIEVIEAVAKAHRMLVLHRDLKPGNILIDQQDRATVIDFGIAKRLDLGDRTEGVLPLSAPYAAPELLTGAPPGPPIDVYGAAAVLYELATGAPPIDLEGVPVALGISRVLDTEPRRILTLRTTTPVLAQASGAMVADLDAILARALRKEPLDRYPTLEALGEDLQRALDGRVVSARSGDRAYRLRRAIWRARWPIAASLAIVAALGGGLVSTLIQKREAIAARDAALDEEARSEAVRQSLYLVLAESVETAGADASAREVLDRATRRITAEFARKPQQSARVLHALGELHFYLGNYAAARAALGPLANSSVPSLPPDAVAAARYDLAQAMVRMGDVESAQKMLALAQGYWRRDQVKWRARLTDSRLVEAQIVRDRDPAAAAVLLKAAMVEHDSMHGAANRQAGVFQNNLGVTLLAAGDREGAATALRKAREIWQRTGLTDTPDALNTANNLAAIETLSGRPEVAEPLFADAVRIRRKLFGASGGTAALLNNHGKVLLQLGRVKEAAAALTEAITMAQAFAGVGSMHHVAALSGLADARLASGAVDALATARQAVAAADLGKAPPSARAMALLSLARVQKQLGDKVGARQSLVAVDAILPTLGPSGARLVEATKQIRSGL